VTPSCSARSVIDLARPLSERALFLGEVFTWSVLYGALVAQAVAVGRPRPGRQPGPEGLALTRRPPAVILQVRHQEVNWPCSSRWLGRPT
jgi:hypothetical protein